MSATEQRRRSKRLDVPNLEDNPAERKRVLNVLAQRRYRRRKKEHVHRLEKLTHQDLPISTEAQVTENSDQVECSPIEISCLDQFPQPQPLNVHGVDQPFSTETMNQQYSFEASFGYDSGTLEAFDYSLSFPLPSLSASPSLTTVTPTSQHAMTQTSRSESTDFDQCLDFPDEAHLPMLELNLLRGAMAVAKRLQVDAIIWSLESTSPFYNSPELTYTHLPINLRPTAVQLNNPHHPALDILPWPSVRDRLILVFSQPEDLRPPSARGPTGLVEFVYDLEDSAEGVRIWGDDPYSDQNWEVGEKLFKNWWWALDGRVVNRSNQLRCNRGANMLGTTRLVEEVE